MQAHDKCRSPNFLIYEWKSGESAVNDTDASSTGGSDQESWTLSNTSESECDSDDLGKPVFFSQKYG